MPVRSLLQTPISPTSAYLICDKAAAFLCAIVLRAALELSYPAGGAGAGWLEKPSCSREEGGRLGWCGRGCCNRSPQWLSQKGSWESGAAGSPVAPGCSDAVPSPALFPTASRMHLGTSIACCGYGWELSFSAEKTVSGDFLLALFSSGRGNQPSWGKQSSEGKYQLPSFHGDFLSHLCSQ